MIRVVLFDFDGVIVDSSKDIAEAVNKTFSHFRYGKLTYDEVFKNIGHGAQHLLAACLNDICVKSHKNFNSALLPEIKNWYIDYYTSHAVVDTTIYDGVMDLLYQLSVEDVRMGIVSNKPIKVTETILEHFDIIDYFDVIVGPEVIKEMKPAPDGIKLAVEKINMLLTAIGEPEIQPKEVMMVGDSGVDIKAAKSFGAKSCGILGGIGNSERLKLENPSFLVNTMTELKISDILKA